MACQQRILLLQAVVWFTAVGCVSHAKPTALTLLPCFLAPPAVCAPGYGGSSATECAAGATTAAKLCKDGYYGSPSRTSSDTACATCPTGRRFTYTYTTDDVYLPGATSRYGANSADDCIAGEPAHACAGFVQQPGRISSMSGRSMPCLHHPLRLTLFFCPGVSARRLLPDRGRRQLPAADPRLRSG